MTDYKELLTKYIKYVQECEGVNFITDLPKQPPFVDTTFTKEEWTELAEVSKTKENRNNVRRSELWYLIYNIIKKIPRKDVEGDAVDTPSAVSSVEDLINEQNNLLNEARYVLTMCTIIDKSGKCLELVDKIDRFYGTEKE